MKTDVELVRDLEFRIANLLDEASSSEGNPGFRERRRRLLEEALSIVNEDTKKRIIAEFDGWGPVAGLLEDPEVTEILFNGPSSLWFERAGLLHPVEGSFLSAANYERAIERLCLEAGAHRSVERPAADGTWKDFRIHASRPPVSGPHSILSLRRHPENPWTLQRLQDAGWCTPNESAMLSALVRQRSNFLVIGATGAGKTSVLNALLAECAHERTIVLEDSDEISVPSGPSLKLLTRMDAQGLLPEVTLTNLLRQSLRLRPDRLVVGEMRGGEAKDFLLALSTGHAGSFGTLHADAPAQALMRLEMLIQMGAPEWGLETVRRLIRLSLQAVVVVGKNDRGERRFKGLHRLVSLEENGFLLEPVESIRGS